MNRSTGDMPRRRDCRWDRIGAPVNGSARLAHDLERRVRLIAGVDEAGAGGAWAGPPVGVGALFGLERPGPGPGRGRLEEVNDSTSTISTQTSQVGILRPHSA